MLEKDVEAFFKNLIVEKDFITITEYSYYKREGRLDYIKIKNFCMATK